MRKAFEKIWKKEGRKTITIANTSYPFIEKEEWAYTAPDGHLEQRVICIDNDIFIFTTKGQLRDEDIDVLINRSKRIYQGILGEHHPVYIISNILKVGKVSLKARKKYKAYFQQAKRNFCWAIYGAPSILKNVVNILNVNYGMGLRIKLVKDMDSAFKFVFNEKAKALQKEVKRGGIIRNLGYQYPEKIHRANLDISLIGNNVHFIRIYNYTENQRLLNFLKGLNKKKERFIVYFLATSLKNITRRRSVIKEIKNIHKGGIVIEKRTFLGNLITLLYKLFPSLMHSRYYDQVDDVFQYLKTHNLTFNTKDKFSPEKVTANIHVLSQYLRDISIENLDHAPLKDLEPDDPFHDLFNIAEVFSHDLKESFDEIKELNEMYKSKNKELLIAKEKAQESDRLKTAFLQNISHEIRTPMNGIIGFTSLLKKTNLPLDKKNLYIKLVEESGTRMINIINDLIDISKIEANQMQVVKTTFDVNELIDEIKHFYEAEAREKKLKLISKKETSERPVEFTSDKTKIIQIFNNLINNSLKFTPEGSIEFGYKLLPGKIEFYVTDTGIGIKPEHKKIIFERFRQINQTLNRPYEGAGIGLSISKGLVQLLGGDIYLQSEYNNGTSFYFSIPWEIQEEKSRVKTDKKAVELKNIPVKGTVLIVDDDIPGNLYLTEVFNQSGCETVNVYDGREAVEMVKEKPDISLVLMDIKLPTLDGLSATREIKKFRPDLPVIAQSAFVQTQDMDTAREAGCEAYLTKPISIDSLGKVMQNFNSRNGKQ
jgi:signal transduction histidine kinase/CheY-like chemotaxis protein